MDMMNLIAVTKRPLKFWYRELHMKEKEMLRLLILSTEAENTRKERC